MHEAENEITPRLEAGEQLLWSGMPKQGVFFRKGDLFLVPFSLMWGGFMIFWEVGVIQTEAPWFFSLFGIPFVLVGIYLIVGRFFMDAHIRARTYYGITDQQVLILTKAFGTRTKSLNLRTLSDISLDEGRNDLGTISLGPNSSMYSWMAGTHWPGLDRYVSPYLEQIREPRSVYSLLRKAQAESA